MKKRLFMFAVLAMVFGNLGFAQSKMDLKTMSREIVFKQMGISRDSYIVPQQANYSESDGTQHRTTYYYDESELYLNEEITETYWDSWQNESRISYEYDFNGNVYEMLGQEWNGTSWEDAIRVSYSYDGDFISEDIYQYYIDGQWVNVIKEVYNYNGDDWTVLVWEWNGTTWTSSVLNTYTRDDFTIVHVMQYMEGGAWQNDEKYTYTLDFDENVTDILWQVWDDPNWVNFEKTTYIFDNGVYTDQYVQMWDDSDWLENFHYTFEYDGLGNAKHGNCLEYDGVDTWVPSDGDIDMAYDYNAKTKSFYGSQVDIVYVDLTQVNENAQTTNVKVYPVPAENELFIQTEDFQKAEIYSVTSQKLMESAMEKMNVSSLSQGVYLLKVYDQSGNSETQRIVVK